jgi:hypothetical protein
MDSRKSSDLIPSHAAPGAGENLMKQLVAVSFLVFAAVVDSFSAPTNQPPASAQELLNRFEAALKAKDTNSVLALYNWEGISDENKAVGSKLVAYIVGQGLRDGDAVKLSPLPAGISVEFASGGFHFFPNIPILGVIEIRQPPKTIASDCRNCHFIGTVEIKQPPKTSTNGAPVETGGLLYGKKGTNFYLSGYLKEKAPNSSDMAETNDSISYEKKN